jgi:hypothetical protein
VQTRAATVGYNLLIILVDDSAGGDQYESGMAFNPCFADHDLLACVEVDVGR